MKSQMLRRRRSEEGKAIRRQNMKEGKGDHCSFKYKQMEIEADCPYSSTITTLTTKDNLMIEVYEVDSSGTDSE